MKMSSSVVGPMLLRRCGALAALLLLLGGLLAVTEYSPWAPWAEWQQRLPAQTVVEALHEATLSPEAPSSTGHTRPVLRPESAASPPSRGHEEQVLARPPPPSLLAQATRPAWASEPHPRLASQPTLPRPRGGRPLPPVYLDHLRYMDAHPHNGVDPTSKKTGSWMAHVTGYSGAEHNFASRMDELASIQSKSGWTYRDSPLGLQVPGAEQSKAPVLTGNAWHWGANRCPAECAQNGGVCLPSVGRCDCPRNRYGPVCEVLVEPAVARKQLHNGWCVYNDSSPFFCDKPICIEKAGERHTLAGVRSDACVGDPLARCPGRCSERGTCRGGRCVCQPHSHGTRCESTAQVHCINDCLGRGVCDAGFCKCRPPHYGVDCSLEPPSDPALRHVVGEP